MKLIIIIVFLILSLATTNAVLRTVTRTSVASVEHPEGISLRSQSVGPRHGGFFLLYYNNNSRRRSFSGGGLRGGK